MIAAAPGCNAFWPRTYLLRGQLVRGPLVCEHDYKADAAANNINEVASIGGGCLDWLLSRCSASLEFLIELQVSSGIVVDAKQMPVGRKGT